MKINPFTLFNWESKNAHSFINIISAEGQEGALSKLPLVAALKLSRAARASQESSSGKATNELIWFTCKLHLGKTKKQQQQ